MRRDNLDLLRALEDDEASARRRALWTSSALVVGAAVILAGLLFSAYRELNAVRATTDALRADSTRLTGVVADLRRIEENYLITVNKDSANLPADSQVVVAPADTLPRVSSTGRDTAGTTEIQLPRPPRELPPRVYLQIVKAGDRRYADSIGGLLDAAGFRVLSVEHVRNAPALRNTELRYYKRADEPDAQRLLRALRASGETNAVLLYLGLENNTRVRPRHYEIWFAADAGQAGRPPAAAP
jgi:hypothetical protein